MLMMFTRKLKLSQTDEFLLILMPGYLMAFKSIPKAMCGLAMETAFTFVNLLSKFDSAFTKSLPIGLE